MNNTDSSALVETQLEAIWLLSDRCEGSWQWSPELAALMQSKLRSELTTEELNSILQLNFCSTLDELIQRLSGPSHL